ncbi:MAG: hypothetical protein KDD66_03475 [Bdellovibrionales bacterium]|nr:hypothetical protein [Bdellovibrionales bacterium]
MATFFLFIIACAALPYAIPVALALGAIALVVVVVLAVLGAMFALVANFPILLLLVPLFGFFAEKDREGNNDINTTAARQVEAS